MALEFDCPYCQATIRVPDAAAGKKGRCPKCAVRLNVPRVGKTGGTGGDQFFIPGPSDADPAEGATPADPDDVIFQEFDPENVGGIDPDVEASLPPGDIALPVLTVEAPLLPPQPVRKLPDSLLSSGKLKRRKAYRQWVIAVVIAGVASLAVAFLFLGGVFGVSLGLWTWLLPGQSLTGTLNGQLVDGGQLPYRVVPKSMVELPAAESAKIFAQLDRSPVPLVSSQANVQFQAGEKGLLVFITPGQTSSLYRVEVAAHPELSRYRREHAQAHEAARFEELSLSVNQFMRTLKKVQNRQTPVAELVSYRDSVGFTSAVRGLGHLVIAGHRKQIYHCVYEDDEALYFLLPAGVKQFQILGKPQKKSRSDLYFPGKFDVKITGTYEFKPVAPPEPLAPPDKSGMEDKEMMEDMEEQEEK